MNIADKVLQFDNHYTHPEAKFTVSQLSGSSGYQLYLHNIGRPKEHPIDLKDRVNAVLGTGFHLRAEEALQDEDVITEVRLFCKISNIPISGTADVIYDNGLETIVGDFKTMGSFQLKKLLRGQVDSFKQQLSIYAYMYAKTSNTDMATKGEIYYFRTGDNTFLGKKEKEEFPYGLPRYGTLQIELMSEREVELFVEERTTVDDTVDCDRWRCNYCEYSCEHRKDKIT